MSLIDSNFFLLNDGTVKTCGYNTYGQLGIGNTIDQKNLVLSNVTDVKQVSCGYYSTFFLLNDGTAKSCGFNGTGELGIGDTNAKTVPTLCLLNNIKQIACGDYHTFFLLNDGTVKACGANSDGRLGTGNTVNQNTPIIVPITNVKQITCGASYTFFLLNDGTVKACGANLSGQLGIGNIVNQNVPVIVPITNVKQIACGAIHTVFLLNDGTVKACGYNGTGQLGIGNTTDQISPVTVPITNVKQISCGFCHTFFILYDGTIEACGLNAQGQLGIGNTVDQKNLVVVLITDVRQISCGKYHTVFLLNDGTIKTCGYNLYGQLGIGNTIDQNISISIAITSVLSLFECISNIDFLFCLIKQNGSYITCKNNLWTNTGLTDFDVSKENPSCLDNYILHGMKDLSSISQEKMFELSGDLEIYAYVDSMSNIIISAETQEPFSLFSIIENPVISSWTDSTENLSLVYDAEVKTDITYSISKDSVSFYGYKNNIWQKDYYMSEEELELLTPSIYQELFGKSIYKEKLYLKIKMSNYNEQQELLLKDIVVTYKENTPPIFIDVTVTPDSFHDEYVSITGTLKDYEGDDSKYRISIKKSGQTDYMVIDDWANISNDSQLFKAYNYPYFSPGENKIKVEAKDSREAISFTEYTVVLLNTGPIVSFTYGDFSVSGTIRDNENDTVSYRLSINGTLLFDYVEFSQSPKDFFYEWRSQDLIFGQSNTIKLEVKDNHGGYTFNEFIVVGKYKGMMLKDETGSYYSDDKSNLLKWLDFGTLISGQTSEVKKVILENSNGFSVDEISVTVGDVYNTLTDAQKIDMVKAEISETETPFIPTSLLRMSAPMNHKDEKELFVRIVTDKYSRQGGELKITTDAKPIIQS